MPMRIKLHLMAAIAAVFLSVYGRMVCPFVDRVEIVRLVAGLCAVGVAQIILREVLMAYSQICGAMRRSRATACTRRCCRGVWPG